MKKFKLEIVNGRYGNKEYFSSTLKGLIKEIKEIEGEDSETELATAMEEYKTLKDFCNDLIFQKRDTTAVISIYMIHILPDRVITGAYEILDTSRAKHVDEIEISYIYETPKKTMVEVLKKLRAETKDSKLASESSKLLLTYGVSRKEECFLKEYATKHKLMRMINRLENANK